MDIPLGTKRREVENFCDPKEGCVTRAIRDELELLRSSSGDPQKRADALRFLIHFVGDMHQPLHAATNNDQGGNCVPVAFFDMPPQLRNPQTESYAPNLHGVWDTNILAKATTGKNVEQVAADLDQSFTKEIARWQKGKANLDTWAWESYELAVKDVYGKLPVRIPVESPQPDQVLRGRQPHLRAHAEAKRAFGGTLPGGCRPRGSPAPRASRSQAGHAAQPTLAIGTHSRRVRANTIGW